MPKHGLRIIALAATLLLALIVFPNGFALALCDQTGGSSGDDIIVCSNPPDPDGIATSWGDDHITVEADTTVGGATSVHAGTGNDVVYNYGHLTPTYDGINMSTGNDTVFQYGQITAPDDGIWCTPQAGETCTVNNYGTVTAINEPLDLNMQTGAFVMYNEGTFDSAEQEAVHLFGSSTSQITNHGSLRGYKSGVETNGGSLSLTNSGLIYSAHEMAINTGPQDDVIDNTGTIQSNYWFAISTSGGWDRITNSGTLTSRNNSSSDSVLDMGDGNDRLTTSGSIIETGAATRAIKAGTGSDTLTIQGGTINRIIDGGTNANGTAENDVLIFAFAGTQEEIDAFTTQIATQPPAEGSATWRGNTYSWQQFEEIRLALTLGPGPTATPTLPPTNTPTITPSPTVTNTPTITPSPTVGPTATSTNTAQPPTATTVPSGGLGTGLHQESATAITYAGTWTNAATSAASGGRYRYSYDRAARVSFSFTGTRLTLIRRIGPARGEMSVCIDGACQTVNNNNSTDRWQQSVSFAVADGTHAVEIRNSGGRTMDLDAVQIESGGASPTSTPIAPTSTTQPPTATVIAPTATGVPPTATTQPSTGLGTGYYEQDHPAITYTGSWQQLDDAGASSGSFRRTNDPSAQASFQFTGTRLTLIALKFSNRGSMEICIDTTNCRTENMYSPSLIWQHPIVFDVSSGTHTVRIRNLSGAYIDVDAVRVEGGTVSPTSAPTATNAPSNGLGAGVHQENHAALLYTGNWTNSTTSAASGGRYKYSYDSAARVSFTFTGTRLTLIRRIGPARGEITLCIDGACQTVNNHNASDVWQQSVSFTVAAGTHTVEIRNSGGRTMDIDAIQIE